MLDDTGVYNIHLCNLSLISLCTHEDAHALGLRSFPLLV